MNTMGRAESRPVSSSGNDGSSQAATSIAGMTVMAPSTHPARPRLWPGWSRRALARCRSRSRRALVRSRLGAGSLLAGGARFSLARARFLAGLLRAVSRALCRGSGRARLRVLWGAGLRRRGAAAVFPAAGEAASWAPDVFTAPSGRPSAPEALAVSSVFSFAWESVTLASSASVAPLARGPRRTNPQYGLRPPRPATMPHARGCRKGTPGHTGPKRELLRRDARAARGLWDESAGARRLRQGVRGPQGTQEGTRWPTHSLEYRWPTHSGAAVSRTPVPAGIGAAWARQPGSGPMAARAGLVRSGRSYAARAGLVSLGRVCPG